MSFSLGHMNVDSHSLRFSGVWLPFWWSALPRSSFHCASLAFFNGVFCDIKSLLFSYAEAAWEEMKEMQLLSVGDKTDDIS